MVSEAAFLGQVTELAEIHGWSWVHFRPAQTLRGWRTPVQGPLGQGWVDLTLVRLRDRRLIFAELKAESGKPDAYQKLVLETLRCLEWDGDPYEGRGDELPIARSRSYLDGVYEGREQLAQRAPRIQVFLWRPSDWPAIVEVLR